MLSKRTCCSSVELLASSRNPSVQTKVAHARAIIAPAPWARLRRQVSAMTEIIARSEKIIADW